MLTYRIKHLAIILLFLATITFPAAGDIYTWTDENGVRHFTNEPPPDIEHAQQQVEIKFNSDRYRQREKERKGLQKATLNDESPAENAETQKASATDNIVPPGKVVIFTTPTCGYCIRAKAFLAKHKIPHTEYDITLDSQAQKRFRELHGNGVPLIFIGKERVIGFNQSRLKKLLGIKE
jgi:glutaredoxin